MPAPVGPHRPAAGAGRKDGEVRACYLIGASIPSAVPHSIECPRCRKVGLVRLETVLRGAEAERQYQCGRCSYAWHERDTAIGADRRRAPQRQVPRERRRAD